MSQFHAAAMGVMAFLFLGATALIGFAVGAEFDSFDADAQSRAVGSAITSGIWTFGGLLTVAYLAAAFGLGSRATWGSALAFFLQPITALTVVGLPIVIWQLVTLTRPVPQR